MWRCSRLCRNSSRCQVAYVANHGVHIGSAQNINLPPALGLGTAGEPEYHAFKRSAATTVNFLGFSSNYQSLQLQLNRRFAKTLGVTTSFTWGKGLGYQTGDDGNLLLLDRSASQLCTQRFRSPAQLRGELDLQPAVRSGQALVEYRPRFLAAGRLAAIRAIVSLYSGLPFNVSANAGTINTPGQQPECKSCCPLSCASRHRDGAQLV